MYLTAPSQYLKRPYTNRGPTYTDTFESQIPSPNPAKALPTNSIGRADDAPCKIAPSVKTVDPIMTTESCPYRSASCPAKNAGTAPINMRKDTTKPRIAGVGVPKVS